MTCLFFRNAQKIGDFIPSAVSKLYLEIAEASGIEIDQVEVHVESTSYSLLLPNGTLTRSYGVHCFVEWHEGRTLTQKHAVATAIHQFLVEHGAGGGSDIFFRDYPLGQSFAYEGQFVEASVVPGSDLYLGRFKNLIQQGLHYRDARTLAKYSVSSISDALQMPRKQLLSIPQIGRQSIEELVQCARNNGYEPPADWLT